MILDYKSALSDCDSAIAIEPSNSKSYFRKATAYKGLGRLDDAITAFENGLIHDPTSVTASKDKDSLVQAKQLIPELQTLCDAKNFRELLARVDKVIKGIGNNFRDFNLLKVEALLELFKTEDAYNLTNSMMKNAQNGDVELLRLRAKCLFTMGDVENSLKHCQQAVRSDPDNLVVRALYRQLKEINEKKSTGDASFKQASFEDAIENYSTCINLSTASKSFSAKVHLNRATAYAKISKFAESVKDCSVAIAYNRQYVKAYTRRAESYMSLGGPEYIDKAIKDYEQALELEADEGNEKALKEKIKKAKISLKRSKKKDLYSILGVSQTATDSEIKKAYRKAALQYHPDKQCNKTDDEKATAEAMFKSIGEAYDILSDSERKERYDQGVEVEDIDNENACAGGHSHGGHGGGHGGGGVDPNVLFHMFMQQQGMRGGR
jgi:DnaJ family protein C protein 7